MYLLQVLANQDIKRGHNKEKDSTVQTTEYRSKRNPNVKPWCAWPKTKNQSSPIPSTDKSFNQNHHRVGGSTCQHAIKEETKKYVHMIRKYHNHKLQTNLWLRKEELQDIYSKNTSKNNKNKAYSSLVIVKMIKKPVRT